MKHTIVNQTNRPIIFSIPHSACMKAGRCSCDQEPVTVMPGAKAQIDPNIEYVDGISAMVQRKEILIFKRADVVGGPITSKPKARPVKKAKRKAGRPRNGG